MLLQKSQADIESAPTGGAGGGDACPYNKLFVLVRVVEGADPYRQNDCETDLFAYRTGLNTFHKNR
jgi:hypothetical protein